MAKKIYVGDELVSTTDSTDLLVPSTGTTGTFDIPFIDGGGAGSLGAFSEDLAEKIDEELGGLETNIQNLPAPPSQRVVLTSSNSSYSIPTEARKPGVRVTVIGGGGGGGGSADDLNQGAHGGTGGTTTFNPNNTSSVSAAGGSGGRKGISSTNGLVGTAGLAAGNGGQGAGFGFGRNSNSAGVSGNGGKVTVAYLNLSTSTSANVSIGGGGGGGAGRLNGGNGGRGEVILEF